MRRFVIAIPFVLVLFGTCSVGLAVVIDTEYVGDLGNEADSTGFGSVAYGYHVGLQEITVSQYAEFLNAKWDDIADLPNTLYLRLGEQYTLDAEGTFTPREGFENEPVFLSDPLNAARFVNWLHNGQGEGDTETGAYSISRDLDVMMGYDTIERQPNAKWALPSVDEWYKAFYLSDNLALEQVETPWSYWAGEWTETILYGAMFPDAPWFETFYYVSAKAVDNPTSLADFQAQYPLTPAETFRVVALVPEPSAIILLLTGAVGLLTYRIRKR